MVPIVLTLTLLLLAGVHLYWAAGGRLGKRQAIPEVHGRPAFQPSRLSTVAVALGLILAAFVASLRGFPSGPAVPGWVHRWASLAIAFFLIAAG